MASSLRVRERTAISSTSFEDLDSYLPISEEEVSNIWQMGKDSKQYWPLKNQAIIAEKIAQNKGRTQKEKFL